MIKTPYEAGGFAFPDEVMMEKAVKEGEGIRYIKNSVDMKDPQMVFGIYCQMAEQGIFETPVGYTYLYELLEYLKANPLIDNRDLPPIPVRPFKRQEQISEQKAPAALKPTEKKTVRRTVERNVDYKPWFKASITVTVILLLIVIGMFAVTATSGNINIVNYENKLIEKYENWDAQLKEREIKLKEREQAVSQKEAQTKD